MRESRVKLVGSHGKINFKGLIFMQNRKRQDIWPMSTLKIRLGEGRTY